MTLAGMGAITNDVLRFRKVIEFESSSTIICFHYIYLIIDGKRSFINQEGSYEINQRLKLWVRVPMAFSSCPANPHVQVNYLNYSPFLRNILVFYCLFESIVLDVTLLITGKTYILSSVLQKLWIAIWVGYIRLKLTFSDFKKFNFLVKTAVKFRNLQISKILTQIKTEFFQFLSRLCTDLWDLHSLKNNSVVSRSG